MSFATAYLLLGATILMFEGLRFGLKPETLLSDFESELPAHTKINLQAIAGGAPIASSLFIIFGLVLCLDTVISSGYLALTLGTVGIVRLIGSIGKPNMENQYVAVAVEMMAAAVAIGFAFG